MLLTSKILISGRKLILRRSIKIKPKRNTNLFGKRKRKEDFLQENTSKNLQKNHLRKILLVRKERKNVGVGSATKKDIMLMNVQIGRNILTKSRYYKPLIATAMKLLKKSMTVYNMFLKYMLIQILHHHQMQIHQLQMNQINLIQTPLLWEGEFNHFVANLQKNNNDNDSLMNLTNPNSIYLSTFLNFKGYKKFRVHCFVDTGASLCLASRFIIPDEL